MLRMPNAQWHVCVCEYLRHCNPAVGPCVVRLTDLAVVRRPMQIRCPLKGREILNAGILYLSNWKPRFVAIRYSKVEISFRSKLAMILRRLTFFAYTSTIVARCMLGLASPYSPCEFVTDQNSLKARISPQLLRKN